MTVRSEGQFNSIVYEESDSYRGTRQRWVVLMSIEDIKRLQIKPGQRITLCSEQGQMQNLSVQEFDLPAGNMMAYYPEANVLTGRKTDPRSKTPAFKSIPVTVKI